MSRDVDGADAEHSHQLIGRQGAVSTPGEPRNARGLGGASYKPERDSTTNRSATGQVSEKKSVFDLMQNVFHVDMESERPRGQDKGDEPAQSRRWNAKGLLRKQPASCFFDMFNERVPCRKLKCTHSLRETLIHERHVPVDVGKLHAAPEPAIHINAQVELTDELESVCICDNTFVSSRVCLNFWADSLEPDFNAKCSRCDT